MNDNPDSSSGPEPVSRDELLADTLVTLADSLVADLDVADLLQTLADRSVALFDAAAAGIMLRVNSETLQVAASTHERSHQVELDEIRANEGPCVDALRGGQVISASSPAEIRTRWPAVAGSFDKAGYRSTHAIPLRLREHTIGTLNLFRTAEGGLTAADVVAAKALADVATIGILHERIVSDSIAAQEQLQHALTSRVVIEQAKGALSQQRYITMNEAFQLLRQHARATHTKIGDVAQAVVGLLQVRLTPDR
ncbi:transcriptional regulator [Curtobacterium sp. MCSS17_008]|uniref:GAF and ANTAR domain-containing protein n=1 Tax=Curtobacterium sp. MCSS17_008 TaxID=2175647 RepID=UPI000DAAB553|nr:GAF and ANTAR domain-containing protein [Curtobacterium sp. MCSS17_008]PZF56794.1 transcriptional regulator [Curtobacterium sp. MCSS17_008]